MEKFENILHYFTCESYELKEIEIIDYDIITSEPTDEIYYKWYKLLYSRDCIQYI